jgi:AraC-like DNA-binding protein
MLHLSRTPAAPLRAFVHDLWLYDGYTPRHARERILPSGTLELVINLRENELRIYDAARPETCRRFSGAVVSGAYGGPFVSDGAEEVSIMGAHFRPGGAFPFLGVPAGELADAHVDLEALWGRSAAELRERLCGAAVPAERLRLLEAALAAPLVRPLEHHDAVPAALEAFAGSGARGTVRDVARRVGLSERRFVEVFTAETGMTPKLFSRVQRFQRARALADDRSAPDWARIAADCGYYDQSHLIRDFLEFSGCSPADFVRRHGDVRGTGQHVKRNHLPLP